MRASFEKYAEVLQIGPGQNHRVSPYRARFEELIKEALSPARSRAEMARLYDSYYSQGELKELLSFYESPLGEKVLKLSHEIDFKLKEAARIYAENELNKKVRSLFDQMRNDLSPK